MEGDGRISEWNEGMFKSARLNAIQENINFLWSNPTGITEGKFNYQWLISSVNILYGEGHSKYSSTERKECDRLMNLIDEVMELVPPAKIVINQGIQSEKMTFSIDATRLKMLLELVKQFERLVKDYNDKHGLTTSNREEEDDWS